MKKSTVKRIFNDAIVEIYKKSGLTNTADKVRQKVFDELDRRWK